MKIIFPVLFLFGFSAFANNPQQRACRLTGGVFHGYYLDRNEIGFCDFGTALIDSMSVMENATLGKSSEAIIAFETGPGSCEQAGAVERNATDLEGHSRQVCLFQDQSAIEIGTLFNGPSSAGNAGLVEALKVHYTDLQ